MFELVSHKGVYTMFEWYMLGHQSVARRQLQMTCPTFHCQLRLPCPSLLPSSLQAQYGASVAKYLSALDIMSQIFGCPQPQMGLIWIFCNGTCCHIQMSSSPGHLPELCGKNCLCPSFPLAPSGYLPASYIFSRLSLSLHPCLSPNRPPLSAKLSLTCSSTLSQGKVWYAPLRIFGPPWSVLVFIGVITITPRSPMT